jgi:hypothetical protein
MSSCPALQDMTRTTASSPANDPQRAYENNEFRSVTKPTPNAASAFDHLTLAIRNYHDSGNPSTMRSSLAVLTALFDRLGRYEPAATIAGFAVGPMTERAFPEITAAIPHLRDVLGDQTYESLAHKGETMTTAAMATYAYDQIDQARTELEHPS